jgi:group I intron endonuclease
MSEEQKQNNKSFGFSNKGKPKSEETKQKISKKLKGKKLSFGFRHTEEHKQKISIERAGDGNPMFGKNHTEETKQKMREKALNIPKVTCPHCHKIGTPSSMTRWHFNNCKNKN